MSGERQRTLERLRKAVERGSRTDRPNVLPLADLTVCPEVFQPRGMGGSDGLDGQHIDALVSALGSKPAGARVLDPITVFAVGKTFYVLDGHHRYAAYQAAGDIDLAPVEHFEGSFEEALSEPLRINGKVHLNLSKEERNGAAWQLVVLSLRGGGTMSGVEIASVAGLSLRTIDRMKAMCRRLMASEDGEDWDTPSLPEAVWEDYREALKADREDDPSVGSEEWLDAIANKWTDMLGSTFGHEGHKHPAIFGKALMGYLGEHIFGRMVEEHGFVPMDHETYERFLEWQDNHDTLTGS